MQRIFSGLLAIGIGLTQQAIETFQKALMLAQQIQDREIEATALLGIGFNLVSEKLEATLAA